MASAEATDETVVVDAPSVEATDEVVVEATDGEMVDVPSVEATDEFTVDAPGAGKLGLIFEGSSEVWQVRPTSPVAGHVYPGCVLLRVDGVAIGALQLFPRSAENDAVAAIGAAANDDGRPRRLTFRYPAAPALPPSAPRLWGSDLGPRERFGGKRGAQAALEVAALGGRRVLVKSLPADATPVHARDLLREAAILSGLAPHPHVVALRACAPPGVAPFVAVDLVEDGVDLEARLKEARRGGGWSLAAPRWTAETGLDVAVQLCRAVAHLHAHGDGESVVHRDLKPANVVLRPMPPLRAPPPEAPGFAWPAMAQKARYKAILVDFGLATTVPRGAVRQLTAETGSPRYMAPEVALGAAYGAPADVYSAALVAWASVAADVPFADLGPREHGDQVHRGGARPPPIPEAPPALAAVLAAAWAPEPADRAPVADLADGLVECLISVRFGDLAPPRAEAIPI